MRWLNIPIHFSEIKFLFLCTTFMTNTSWLYDTVLCCTVMNLGHESGTVQYSTECVATGMVSAQCFSVADHQALKPWKSLKSTQNLTSLTSSSSPSLPVSNYVHKSSQPKKEKAISTIKVWANDHTYPDEALLHLTAPQPSTVQCCTLLLLETTQSASNVKPTLA